MHRLEEILSSPDRIRRLDELIRLARSLKVDPGEAQARGEYNEEKLVLLVYDVLRRRHKRRTVNLNFLWGGLGVSISVFLLIGLLPGLAKRLIEEEKAEQLSQQKLMQGYDEEGNPILQGDKPVMFSVMEGTYKEFDEKGLLKYENFYEEGYMVHQKEYDRRGRVISEKSFPRMDR